MKAICLVLESVFLHLLLCATIVHLAQSQTDLVGVVNVGYHSILNHTDAELFTVSVNEQNGELPITLAVYNISSDAFIPNDIINEQEEVNVYCEVVTSFVEGVSSVTFELLIVQNSKQSNVQFNVLKQGRPVEVMCQGSNVNQPGLFQNSTLGLPGYLAVVKSPVVSFCEEMIVIPDILTTQSYTSQFTLQFSEIVVESDVNITCEVDPEYVGNGFLLLEFSHEIVPIDSIDVTVTYSVLEKSDIPVRVTCTAQSIIGRQYLSDVSSGSKAMFGFAVGTAEFVPFISNVVSRNFKAFLILGAPVQEEVAFSCYLIPVNTSEEARQTAENPVCERPADEFIRPSAAPPQTTDVQCANNNTCAPTTANSATSAVPTQSVITNSTFKWNLQQPVVVFENDDYYKAIEARYVDEDEGYSGLLVLTCCASADINQDSQYINVSAALLMVADIASQRYIDWILAADGSNVTDETEFTNPAYVELGPCNCDLTQDHCDVLCCCDTDCTEDDLALFPCLPGIPGGNFTEDWEYSCNNTDIFRPDWYPFLCVQTVNKLFLGYFFPSQSGATDRQQFENLKPSQYTSFEENGDRSLEFPSASEGYKHGIPIQLLYDETVIGLLALPQRSLSNGCSWRSPVKYQINSESSCVVNITRDLNDSVLNARLFVQTSDVTHPPCPESPLVISTFEYSNENIAPSQVVYYCLEDLTKYLYNDDFNTLNFYYTKSLPPVTEEEKLSLKHCVWDDGFTRPPVPTYNNETLLCDNTVLHVEYEIFWRGGEVLLLKGTVYIGSVPCLPSGTLLTTRYSTKFTHQPPTTVNIETGTIEIPEEIFQRSGNPGYQIGKPLLSGVTIYQYVNLTTPNPACNGNNSQECIEINEAQEFVHVDTSSQNRLKYLVPGLKGLCEDSSYEDITFGENVYSGCLIRIGLSDLNNCTILRGILETQLQMLVKADSLARIGNASFETEADWLQIFKEPIEYDVVSTVAPYQERVNEVFDQLIGTCYHMPTGVHLHILIADAGMYRGLIQQEIVAAKISYRTQMLQLKCAGANSASCQQNTSYIYGEWMQPFLLSNWITFTTVPAVKPQPVIMFFDGVDESLCKQDKCPEEAFYPLTRAFLGQSLQYTLAVWLSLTLFLIAYFMVTKPWW